MALPLANTLEGGTNTTAISAANSGGASGDAFTAVSGAAPAPTFSSVAAAHGSMSYLLAQPAVVAGAYVEWDSTVIPNSTHLYGRVNVQFSTLAQTTACRLVRFLSGTTTACSISISTTGGLQIHASTSGNTAIGTQGANMTANTWYRIEWDITFGTGTSAFIFAKSYLGDSATVHGTADATDTFTGLATLCNVMRVGNLSGGTASTNYYFDDLLVTDVPLTPPSAIAIDAGRATMRVRG